MIELMKLIIIAIIIVTVMFSDVGKLMKFIIITVMFSDVVELMKLSLVDTMMDEFGTLDLTRNKNQHIESIGEDLRS